MQNNENLNAEDVRNLNIDDLTKLKATGSHYLQTILQYQEPELDQERER